jgi:hypothetical protein
VFNIYITLSFFPSPILLVRRAPFLFEAMIGLTLGDLYIWRKNTENAG